MNQPLPSGMTADIARGIVHVSSVLLEQILKGDVTTMEEVERRLKNGIIGGTSALSRLDRDAALTIMSSMERKSPRAFKASVKHATEEKEKS